ncbi:hypothetical protein [Bradyrhizobium lablabi]|uniref:hypothetical protein n=1 Tax=Bradyrhizobium lablabi TaxID=722472 RepID=UPI0020133BA5|nr:hypothetical protein [Bradyrhizobium lablabi]
MAKPAHHRPLKTLSIALATSAALAFASVTAATAAPLQPIDLAGQHATEASDVNNVAVVVRRGGGVGPRGNAYRYRSTTVVRPGGGAVVVRPGYPGRWARPSWYRWGPGGAIAAGAALGFVAAAGAAAYAASAAPAPGMCWYYTDPTRTQGFWDYCP